MDYALLVATSWISFSSLAASVGLRLQVTSLSLPAYATLSACRSSLTRPSERISASTVRFRSAPLTAERISGTRWVFRFSGDFEADTSPVTFPKGLSALTQAGMLHLKGDRVAAARVDRSLQTSCKRCSRSAPATCCSDRNGVFGATRDAGEKLERPTPGSCRHGADREGCGAEGLPGHPAAELANTERRAAERYGCDYVT
ncbi:hypothetical protein KFL_001770080 [Klebsormidium nitens]|uniref:Uncharacterized protein n=1 Tax=Klebsormidium nitens TaxID=105231 RepID=A0A1Y1I0Z5_KLENI|nr:hypothetical protein KFL_001770080 [Klebsormidium nitens]|eukprot:GAQ84123.1 hypothetical protein KFL_001770080 [Klebsormidium nitens]